jgi:hypothetical protein
MLGIIVEEMNRGSISSVNLSFYSLHSYKELPA